ncbi:hypothetical protein BU26DRAFT_566715 [Trematosphaeria pertusa]|uniref:Uncharacterized protein n=1 Tax=Trematosphaeria pertusa TaxID=390896 RepID=A0A6A6ICH3_9PLEO|nr:uncharacterized protein BU26DRAFT_566715 [Trematosphaeria pertusa]KAF2247768.1 hypothetical protein BU26DRAFT_566715 [Trematosphaeria pertusa]
MEKAEVFDVDIFEVPGKTTDILAGDWFYQLEESIRRNAYALVREIGDYFVPAVIKQVIKRYLVESLPQSIVSPMEVTMMGRRRKALFALFCARIWTWRFL